MFVVRHKVDQTLQVYRSDFPQSTYAWLDGAVTLCNINLRDATCQNIEIEV